MSKGKVGILVGGGPAPGINGVIAGAGIGAVHRGYSVVGIEDGFSNLMKGDTSRVRELCAEELSTIHNLGGSVIGTSRANPTKKQESLEHVVQSLEKLGITKLITIGGDDTATSAQAVARYGAGKIAVGHVPKTIDNDLPLPEEHPTFGFLSACEAGTRIVDALLVDARTTKRWYLGIAMGRKTGHLTLGIGFSAGATLTIIPEEITAPTIPLSHLVNKIVGSIIKRAALGNPWGVVLLAEGLLERLDVQSVPELQTAERDPHGHIRYAEIDFGGLLRRAVQARLQELGAKETTVVEKNIGYELRCVEPNTFDRSYTRLLGFGILDFVDHGGTEAMISLQRNRFVPIPFAELIDPETKKTKVRFVETNSTVYQVSQHYSTQLAGGDLQSEEFWTKVSAVVRVSREQFLKEFSDLTTSGTEKV